MRRSSRCAKPAEAVVRTALILGLLCGLMGCASAMPALVGGSITPDSRTDVVLGAAARLSIGDSPVPELDDSGLARAMGAGGIVPVAAFRRGLSRSWDLGLTWAGTDARLDVRYERLREAGTTRKATIFGFALSGGYVGDSAEDEGHTARGMRFGVDIPIAWAVEFGGLYEIWFGPRFGAEHVRGEFSSPDMETAVDAQATSVRGGIVLGIGIGFRRLMAQIELTVQYEHWFGDIGDAELAEGGFTLLPAFVLRFRL